MIYYDYLSMFTLKVGSYLWNLDNAFWNFTAPYCFAGFIVKLITASGTCILWHRTMFVLSPGVKVSPVEHYTPNIANMSPALTY